MDFRNTDDRNVFVPNEMNTTQLPTFITALSIFTYYFTIWDTTNAIIEIWQSAFIFVEFLKL